MKAIDRLMAIVLEVDRNISVGEFAKILNSLKG